MSPFAVKILRLVAGAVSITGLSTVYMQLKGFSSLERAAVALVGLVVYVVFYRLQISDVDTLVGIYMPVRRLKQNDERLASLLGIQPYYEYYRERPEDNTIRACLKENGGVVILGRPFSGKTRAALRAIVETNPDAYVVSFTSPDRMIADKMDKIFLPSFFIFFAKPEVVILIDHAPRFAQRPFEELRSRLLKQCSRLSIVVTCRTGVDQNSLAEGDFRQLVGNLPRVELGPLDQQARTDIYSHVWNQNPGPLGVDMSLPGLIIYGPQRMRDDYRVLPTRGKRIITALGLARACGAEACERAFLNEILRNVFSQDVAGIGTEISDMVAKYILSVDARDNISIQHDEFLLADYGVYYPKILDLRNDLEKLESLATVSGNADRLLQLGLYYWSRLQDLASARRLLEASLQLKPSAFTHASIARLYLNLKEPHHARLAIDAALAATKEENKKAVTLMLFADEVLFKLADGEKALGWYTLAAQHATDQATSARISFRRGDCLVRLKRFPEAEPVYRDYLKQAPAAEKIAVTARLFLSILAQDRAREARELLQNEWNGMARQERLDLALSVFENAEGFFSDMASHLLSTSNSVFEEYRDCVLNTQEPDGIGSLSLFADSCLVRGFLAPAVSAYRFLIDQAHKFHIEERELINLSINSGAGLRDSQKFADARAAFRRAQELAGQNPAWKGALSSAKAGLADCDLFENQSVSSAGAQYREALNLANESNDDTAVSWARMGLGDIDVMTGEFHQAKDNYGARPLILNSVSGRSRIDLGMARACLELDELDDAEFYIGNGIALTVRLDYRFRQMQFRELEERLAKKRAGESASSVAAS